jgi:glycerol-3-phosphate acyltransferase PlsX
MKTALRRPFVPAGQLHSGGSRLVRDGCAQGFVSAGNTGAVMATAKMVQGVVPGVERPAILGVLPTVNGNPVVLVDVGANVDCTPEMLAQFAVMGQIYSRQILHQPNPRVGILSIGEESHKGNDLTRAAAPLFSNLRLNFIGNVEGRDIYGGKVDVIVCDGFIGNVALKGRRTGGYGETTVAQNRWRPPFRANWLPFQKRVCGFKKRVDYYDTAGRRYRAFAAVIIATDGATPMRSRTRFAWQPGSPTGK